jgi:hypothetical protein
MAAWSRAALSAGLCLFRASGGLLAGIRGNVLAGFRVADEVAARRKLSQGFESCLSIGNRAYLSDPQRAAVIQAPKDVETQPHIGIAREIPRPASAVNVPAANRMVWRGKLAGRTSTVCSILNRRIYQRRVEGGQQRTGEVGYKLQFAGRRVDERISTGIATLK